MTVEKLMEELYGMVREGLIGLDSEVVINVSTCSEDLTCHDIDVTVGVFDVDGKQVKKVEIAGFVDIA